MGMTSLPVTWTLLLAWTAGLSIPVGALVASNVVLRDACLRLQLDSFVSYLGGAALLAAIALVLIPRGIENASLLSVSIAFGAGGLCCDLSVVVSDCPRTVPVCGRSLHASLVCLCVCAGLPRVSFDSRFLAGGTGTSVPVIVVIRHIPAR